MDRPPESSVIFLDACVLYPWLTRGIVLGVGAPDTWDAESVYNPSVLKRERARDLVTQYHSESDALAAEAAAGAAMIDSIISDGATQAPRPK